MKSFTMPGMRLLRWAWFLPAACSLRMMISGGITAFWIGLEEVRFLQKLMVNVVAAEEARILFLDVGRILKVCSNSCVFHHTLIENLLKLSAEKNLRLSKRIFHISSKSIRGRLLSYLSYQAMENGKKEFDIPFNRQQLADYLNVDRSAMSNELGKMQKDRMIEVDRKHFRILGEMEI